MNKSRKLLDNIIIMMVIIILAFPKINIISISGVRNGIRIDDIAIAIFFVAFLINVIKKNIKLDIKQNKIYILFATYILICIISAIKNSIVGNVQIIISLLYVVRKVEYFILIFAGIEFYKTSNNKEKLLKLLNGILLFHVIYSILEYNEIIPDIGYLIGRPINDRIYTTFSGPYEFSAFFSIMSCIYIVEIFKNKKYSYSILLTISIIEILISQSRISLIAVFFTIIIAVFYYLKSKKQKVIILFGSIIAIILFIVLINFTDIEILNRFKIIDINSSINTIKMAWNNTNYEYYLNTQRINYNEDLLNSSSDLSFIYRISKWVTLLKETLNSPILGLGPSIVGEGIDGNYIRIICETGILGLILWSSIIIIILKETIKNKEYTRANYIFFTTINLLIIALFIDIFEASKIMCLFWFLIGIFITNKEEIKDEKKIKIVHVVSGINYGGVESVLYNYFSNISNNKLKNTIISHEKINEENGKMFKKLGFSLYEVTPKRKNLIKNFNDIYKIVQKIRPDILHVHMTSSGYIALLVGKICGVKVRICHSHLSYEKISIKNKIYNFLCNKFANVYMACSENSGEYMFGKKNVKNGKVIILKNAIEIEKFKYDNVTREKARKKLRIENKKVIGNIGRLSEQKNQIRLIEIFYELHKQDKDTFLIIIGNGENKGKIKQKIIDCNLQDSTIIINGTTKIEDYYQAMDVFVFPSLYEGLGIVLIEAQISGLPCIASTAVPRETNISNTVTYIELKEKNKIWVEQIEKKLKQKRNSNMIKILNSDYNIKNEASKLENIYTNMIKKGEYNEKY